MGFVCYDHICGRGWHWEMVWECQGHGLVASPCPVVTERSPRAQRFLVTLKLLPGLSPEVGASKLLPSTALAVLGASAPSSCQFGVGERLLGLSGCPTVLTESGHQPVTQEWGKEIVLSNRSCRNVFID